MKGLVGGTPDRTISSTNAILAWSKIGVASAMPSGAAFGTSAIAGPTAIRAAAAKIHSGMGRADGSAGGGAKIAARPSAAVAATTEVAENPPSMETCKTTTHCTPHPRIGAAARRRSAPSGSPRAISQPDGSHRTSAMTAHKVAADGVAMFLGKLRPPQMDAGEHVLQSGEPVEPLLLPETAL